MLFIGLVAGTAVAGGTAEGPVPESGVNERGETYGPALQAEVEPDLILAQGEDGTIGYVRSDDLDGDMPGGPEEALQQQAAAEAAGGRVIPLYDEDGVTVIGEFLIDPPEAEEVVVGE